MENLILSFNVVAPLFLMMVLGYFLKYIKIFDQLTLDFTSIESITVGLVMGIIQAFILTAGSMYCLYVFDNNE